MSKRKRAQKNNPAPIVLTCSNEIGTDDLQHILADALVEADEKKRQILEKQREKENEAWRESIGIKDYSHEKNPRKWFLEFFNTLGVFVRISFISRNKIRGDRITFSLLKLAMSLVFSIAGKILLLLSIYLFFAFPIIEWYQYGLVLESPIIMSMVWGFLAFLLSGLFHVSSLEVENIKDRNYIVGLFTCVTGIVTILISIFKRS